MCPRKNNICQNTDGSYECQCKNGYPYKNNGGDCLSEEIKTVPCMLEHRTIAMNQYDTLMSEFVPQTTMIS